MVLDSLRYWVQEFHVDGFRFDLAVALGRGRGDEFDPDHPFLVALRTDPVLSRVTLIAEPWDLGCTAGTPASSRRRSWTGTTTSATPSGASGSATCAPQAHGQHSHGLQASPPGSPGRATCSSTATGGRLASVNFVTAHDGFTLADLTSYDRKHNEANGEENRDGHGDTVSYNHGVEGPTEDADILAAARAHHAQPAGTPDALPGRAHDHRRRRDRPHPEGNNNAYCQDNAMSWIDWDLAPWQRDLLATTQHLVRVRQELPALRQRVWALGRQVHDDGSRDMEWYAADGTAMGQRWDHPGTRVVQMYVAGAWMGADSALVVVNGGAHEHAVTLPAAPGVTAYRLLWDSDYDRPQPAGEPAAPGPVTVAGTSLRVYAAADVT